MNSDSMNSAPYSNKKSANWAIFIASIAACILFAHISNKIDFHPDEAIYFDGIAVSLNNDTGLFYNLVYSALSRSFDGVWGARLASALMGGCSLYFVLRLLKANTSKQAILITSFAFCCSYQAIFVFDRVRPEAAWWALTCGLALALQRLDRTGSVFGQEFWLTALLLMLLPMNHRLSWFPAVFAIGYILLFLSPKLKAKGTSILLISPVSGVLLNIALRALWLGQPISSAFRIATTSAGGLHQGLRDFAKNVFHLAPKYLNDIAQNENIYHKYLHITRFWATHEYIQNSLWASMIALPFMGQTWRERYVFSFPIFVFLCFFGSGYYNPTYAAGFSLACVMIACYVLLNKSGARKHIGLVLCGISILNGISFLSTRVLNHGDATYYSQLSHIVDLIKSDPSIQSVSIPERFQIAATSLKERRFVNYKSVDIRNVDFFVYDNYDSLMYGFVPDFDKRTAELKQLAGGMCLLEKSALPVYLNDSLYPTQADEMGGSLSKASSWFFRNSATYTLYIFKRCHQSMETSSPH